MDAEEGEIVEPPVKRPCLENINDVMDSITATKQTDSDVTEEGELVEPNEQACPRAVRRPSVSATQQFCGILTEKDGSVETKTSGIKLKVANRQAPSLAVGDELYTAQTCLKDTDSVMDGAHMPGSPITEFEIIDDLDEDVQGNEESDYMESVGPDQSDEDLDDNEIYAWLEEGIDKQAVQGTGAGGTTPIEREKVVLKGIFI